MGNIYICIQVFSIIFVIVIHIAVIPFIIVLIVNVIPNIILILWSDWTPICFHDLKLNHPGPRRFEIAPEVLSHSQG
jgi:hypothetical protein